MPIRDAVPADIPSITAIYAHYVQNTLASMAIETLDEKTTLQTFETLKLQGFPYLVFVAKDSMGNSESDGSSADEEVTGYAYARPYHDRKGYDKTAETSVYLDPGYTGQGQGRELLQEVIARLSRAGSGKTQLIAQISLASDVPNDEAAMRRASSSVALHSSVGFQIVGRLSKVGCKFERQVDVVIMQRALVEG